MKRYLLLIVALLVATTSFAEKRQKTRVFYDEKNDDIYLSFETLPSNENLKKGVVMELLPAPQDLLITRKIHENRIDLFTFDGNERAKSKYDKWISRRKMDFKDKEVAKMLAADNAGKKVLDLLFCYDGKKLSMDLLTKRANENIQTRDMQRASVGVIDRENILSEDVLPILENNYIYLQRAEHNTDGSIKKVYWAVCHVDIDESILEQVFSSWNDMSAYNQIEVPISFVASGKSKMNTKVSDVLEVALTDARDDAEAIDSKLYDMRFDQLNRDVCKDVAQFRPYGQADAKDGRSFSATIDKAEGLINKKDRICIYRAHQDKKGQFYSTPVAYGRVYNVTGDVASFRLISGRNVSLQKGDMAVQYRDKNRTRSIGLNLGYPNTVLNLNYEFRLAYSRFGGSLYGIIDFGLGFNLDQSAKKPSMVPEDGSTTDAVVDAVSGMGGMFAAYAGVGLGYGIQLTRLFELEPYVLGQVGKFNGLGSVRVPIGARMNFNIKYPGQIYVGLEYAVYSPSNFDFGVKVGYRKCF